MGFYPTELIDEVRERSPIGDIIGQYVKLKKRGKNLVGLCPFHNEKTPSFTVNIERKSYYCFGCHAKGNVFTFLMEFKKVDFPDAVKEAAEYAGITLYTVKGNNSPQTSIRDQIAKANEEACMFYHKNLLNPTLGRAAMTYLEKRGLKRDTIKQFRLGYARDSWDSLLQFLTQANFKPDVIERADLIKTGSTGKQYDSFRNRVIFPIWDEKDRVVAFGGRILDAEQQPKYLNSANHPLFNKGELLYNLNFAKTHIRNLDTALIAEGYMDVIGLWQAGVKNVVAPMGTALREAHTKRLIQYCSRLILVFDGDDAGKRAAEAALIPALKSNLHVAVVVLPPDMDPFDFVSERGKVAWEDYLREHATEALEYKVQTTAAQYELDSHIGKRQFLEANGQFLRDVDDEMVSETYIKIVGKTLDMPVDTVRKYLLKGGFSRRNVAGSQPVGRLQTSHYLMNKEKKLLLALMLNKPLYDEFAAELSTELFHHPLTRKFYRLIVEAFESEDPLDLEWLTAKLEDDKLSNEIYQVAMENIPFYEMDPSRFFMDTLLEIKRLDYEIRMDQINEELKKINPKENPEFYRICQEEYKFLVQEKIRLGNTVSYYNMNPAVPKKPVESSEIR